MNVKLLTKHQFDFLRLKGIATGSYESAHVKMSHCWKSHVTAHIIMLLLLFCPYSLWCHGTCPQCITVDFPGNVRFLQLFC